MERNTPSPSQIKLRLISHRGHNSQIVTGFLMLAEKIGCDLEIIDNIHPNSPHSFTIPPIVECEYRGLKIAYDTEDGYFTDIKAWVEKYDLYFKRSFSAEKNSQILGDILSARVFPLGFNYFVTYKNNPYGFEKTTPKTIVKHLLGRKSNAYFTPDKFIGQSRPAGNKVIFFARLWKPEDYLSEAINAERIAINKSRIALVRELQACCGSNFIGGFEDSELARQLCPDLIVPAKFTRRENYLKLLHDSDIAIGSIGLHESIGWKTGEYVAAGKAIVNERFHYSLPGNFRENTHYLPFETPEECIRAVVYLHNNPQAVAEMQANNRQYYDTYLSPDKLVANTLAIADSLC